MRRLLMPLLLLPALVLPALATAPAGAAADHHGRSGAAAPRAVVKSVLKRTPSALKGKLTSDRKSCIQDRDIYLLIRLDGSPYPDAQYFTTTNAKGKWTYPLMKRGGTLRLSAITLGGPSCQIAQSNQITYDGARGGATSRAPGVADVSITLQGSTVDDGHGQITSSRDVCHEFRPVIGFIRPEGTHGTFASELISISKRNGSYQLGVDGSMRRLGGTTYDTIAVVPGTNNCRPAQSKQQTIDFS